MPRKHRRYELQGREIIGQAAVLPWTAINSHITTLQYEVQDLVPATDYQFRVRSRTPKYGWSGYDGCAESAPLRTADEEPEPLDAPPVVSRPVVGTLRLRSRPVVRTLCLRSRAVVSILCLRICPVVHLPGLVAL